MGAAVVTAKRKSGASIPRTLWAAKPIQITLTDEERARLELHGATAPLIEGSRHGASAGARDLVRALDQPRRLAQLLHDSLAREGRLDLAAAVTEHVMEPLDATSVAG